MIHEHVAKVQQLIVANNKTFEKANISLPTLHITLAVMWFDAKDNEVVSRKFVDTLYWQCGPKEEWWKNATALTSDHITSIFQLSVTLQNAFPCRTTNAMEEALAKIRPILNKEPLTLVFRCLDHFSNKVLFAKIDGKEALDRIVWISKVVKEAFAVEGVTVKDEELKAHLTIMKLSKMDFKERKIVKKIDPALYDEAKDLEFGDETVTSLQLLSMEAKDEDGYYRCLKEVFIKE